MKNYWLTSGFYSLLNQLTQMIFNLGTVMILWRVLDKETCSIWVIYMTITAFIEISRTGLLQNGLGTFLNTTPQYEHAKINTASLFLSLMFSLIFVVLLLLGADAIGQFFHSDELSLILRIYAGTTFIASALYQFNFIQQANMDFKGLFWSSFVRNGALFFAILFLKLTNSTFSITFLAIIQLLAAIPSAGVAYAFAKKYFKMSAELDWNWVKKLFHYGKYTFGTNLMTMLYKNVDKMLLGRMLVGTVSTYDLSIKVNNLADVPTMTLATILFPQSAKRSHTEGVGSAKYLYEKSVGILLGLIWPVTLFILLFADVIIGLIGSDKYANSANILRITIFYSTFLAFAIPFGTVLDSIKRPRLNFYITTLGALVTLAANYFFIKQFGLFGAAYGTLSSMLIMFVVMQTILKKLVGVQILSVFGYLASFYREMWGKGQAFWASRKAKKEGLMS